MDKTKRPLLQKLGLLGLVSLLSYAAAVVFAALGLHLFCMKPKTTECGGNLR